MNNHDIDQAAKLIPPAGVSLATIYGIPVSDLVLWATLIYTVMLIGHKLFKIFADVEDRHDYKEHKDEDRQARLHRREGDE